MSLQRGALPESYHLPSEGLDYATPSTEAWSKPSCPQFTCEVCCLIMSAGAREHHLTSQSHAIAVKKRKQRERETRKIIDALREREKSEIRAKKDGWTCWVCVRSMKRASMESHLAGSLHHSMQELPWEPEKVGSGYGGATGVNSSWTCGLCTSTMPISSKGAHLSGRSHAKAFAEKNSNTRQLEDRKLWRLQRLAQWHYWACDVCDVSIACYLRDEHLSDENHHQAARKRELKRHRIDMKVRVDMKALREWKAVDEMWIRELGLHGPQKYEQRQAKGRKPNKQQQKKYKRPERNEKQLERLWSCDVCCYTMDIGCRDGHLLGKKHARNVDACRMDTHRVEEREETEAQELKREVQGRKRDEVQDRIMGKVALKRWWVCDGCGSTVDMFNRSRDAHLLGNCKKHDRRVKIREQTESQELKREAQDRKRRKKQLERQWTCDVCDLTMDGGCRDGHLLGKKHAGRVKSGGIGAQTRSARSQTVREAT